jgi:5S rRNA maturation endonuclease (ribonuclease M5)
VELPLVQLRLGIFLHFGKWWVTIPIKDKEGKYSFFKLRQNPEDSSNPDKYKFYPPGSNATIFGWDMLEGNKDSIVICEGEFDSMLLNTRGIPAITSTAGAMTFKEEWIEQLKNLKKIYLCFDKDDAGEKGMQRLAPLLERALPQAAIFKITLPERMTEGKDVTDYFTKYNGTPDELMYQCATQVAGRQPIDTTKFKPLSSEEILEILGLTIKKDEENKLVSFLCELSAYTENAQFNISFNAPSSTGKSYIPTEVARLFPTDDVIEIGYCSPTAFFHDVGQINKERGGYEIDLSRKILIFLDQPHTMLLERLRPLLSHDKKEMHLKITDKSQKGGLKTKNVFIKGFPAVVFCSAGLQIDEQEGTRFMLLSPETNQEKIREAIHEKIRKESDNNAYSSWLKVHPGRLLLKERIEAIREEKIEEVRIADPRYIEQVFLENKLILKPRHQRDIGRLISLIKAFALVNLWFREREGAVIIANGDDIRSAIKIWEKISQSQEYNLPPYIYNFYREVIVAAYQEKNDGLGMGEVVNKQGISRQDIFKKHSQVYGRILEDFRLRQQILPMLETAGLITQEQDPNNRRRVLVFPTTELSSGSNNIVSEAGEDVVN